MYCSREYQLTSRLIQHYETPTSDDFYDLYVFDLSYVIHVYIYLSLDKTELRTQNTEPVLLQISKGKTVF